ncbi:TraR/DksA C4-type zinc finger protein [Pseudonocardia sp. WMMC193]|uniref:TraR/DksA family transcriptional regulator n=1 Tax=Pseudonocardia sp. WMMC193 TaxID=2911965 RepID=UPI001F492C4F|nr:TraR/DksA C4-type zinc finger protein [Pseudonocardia sp. WMMC193]MCF7553545.1 TraR/DksA C4-type zinc finger protein [Pseudonocardia sp. WMMC193]
MDDTTARDLLTAERDRLDGELRTESADEAARRDALAEQGAAGEDFGDAGADLAHTTEGELSVDTIRRQRREVGEALDRVDRGEYGRCVVCGREIDDERLRARPEAQTCREHAA